MKHIIRLLGYTKKYWVLLLLTALSVIGVTGMNLIVPWQIKDLVSILTNIKTVDASMTSTAMNKIVEISIILLGAYLLRMVFRFASSYLSHLASWNVVAELRTAVYSHLQKLSLSYYHEKQTGQLMSRVVNDTAVLEQLVAHSIPDLASNFLIFIGVTILMFIINAKLALLTLIPIPFIFVLALIFSKRIRPFFKEAQERLADLNATLQDNLSGIREIQVFNQQKREKKKIHEKAMVYASNYAGIPS